ncbi:MAG: UDP-N-acetylglucosamine--N-acetylmuramyl-(pentapeptide) pyrophosphoryl-undecaprenol N-acetylglucosamine transferase [Patescibacteria group bacterium]
MARVKKIKILFAGGGTGGHIFPLIAVGEHLMHRITDEGLVPDIRYFGSPGTFRGALEESNIRVTPIASSKWRNYVSILNILDIFKFAIGLIQSFWKVYWFMPHAVFTKGGPGTVPIIYACRFYTIPIIVHESDAIPGRAVRIAAKRARRIELSFPDAAPYFPNNIPSQVTGNPVRSDIVKRSGTTTKDGVRASKLEFGFNPDEPVVLVIGGSQGAAKLNEFVLENLSELLVQFQVLHQTGLEQFTGYNQEYSFMHKGMSDETKRRYHVVPFFSHNIASAYEAADIVIARAGSGLIFEIAAMRKPAILIPLENSAHDHQKINAYAYAKLGGASVVEEDNMLGGILITAIQKILSHEEIKQNMANAAEGFFRPDAAMKIGDDIVSVIANEK